MSRKSSGRFRIWYLLVPLGLIVAVAAAVFLMGKSGPTGENEWITFVKANTGDAEAQYLSGLPYDKRRGGVNDEARAVGWYEKAAAQGHVEAQIALADLYNDDKTEARRDKAFTLYSGLKAPTPAIKRKLAEFHLTGRGSVKKDVTTGEGLLREAAEAGDAPAQKAWGQRLNAMGDREGAKPWLNKCADRGDNQCLTDMAYLLYNTGERPAAIAYFNRAADRGHADAQIRLSMLHFNGMNVAKDQVLAYKWALLAQKGPKGSAAVSEARSAVPFIESHLTPAQIAEGKKQAEAFKPAS
ncbi:tetratricopeptide repeat protein [Asticcacaulis sp. AND118]|uniref:tetratricopeptide repeat protein n=1 Tax=Asticcacaulis sp. AND118 TaxID=2840468 RepID=UPI001CFF562F|nr:tetratricopeptide repeat protein [Asticcacaulis sp. AND118]UDF03075.1 sel1 repeat family protein [Asticcacaulis sp. AND118]